MKSFWRAVPNPCENEEFPRKNALIIFVYSFVSLVIYWVRTFPCIISPDAINQWEQIHSGQYNDIHPMGHTIFLKWLLSIYDNFAIVILVQVIMFSVMFACYAYYFSKKKIRLSYQLLLVSIFTSGFCSIGAYTVPLKDAPYTFCAGMLILMMIWNRRIRI